MKTVYKSSDSKAKIIKLYDKQMEKLNIPYQNVYVETTFGKTHLIETGNLQGKPLIIFHGGNSTTAYNLSVCYFLLDGYHVYAVDTIGHPGKSAEVYLSPNNYDYGKWASEVITALGYEKMLCFGGSFGGGILAKTMCVAPVKIEKAVLLVPAGIKNAPAYKTMNMLLPMILYFFTHNKKWLIKCILPMSVTEDNIDENTYETVKCIIDNVKIKVGMPSDVRPKDMQKCQVPALVMAGQKDCLFPADLVLPQAKRIIPNCTAYLLEERGHMNTLTMYEKKIIIDFLK